MIAALQRQVSSLSRKKNKPRIPRAPTTPKELDPITTAVKAMINPFVVEKGIAAPLADGRPSQKFMAKAQTSITVPSGYIMAFMASPTCSSDATNPSVMIVVGTANAGNFSVTQAFYSGATATAAGLTYSTLTTNTPYSAANLNAGNFDYCCTGSGLRFTYDGTELNRGGTFRYVYDNEAAYNPPFDWATASAVSLVNFINSAPNAVRQSINKNNVVEINASITRSDYDEATSPFDVCYTPDPEYNDNQPITTAASNIRFAHKPSMLGYYVNPGSQVTFHVEVVEHWSLSAPTIQALQTPSYAHTQMATHVQAVLMNVRQAHATQPNVHHVDVAKSTVSAMKSPLGHEILNTAIRAALV
jgi:hypothetical protein